MRMEDFVPRRILGNGSHGLVMCWRRIEDGTDFAAKLFASNRLPSFERERVIYSSIEPHRNILPLIGSIQQNGKNVLLFPFLDGGDLFGALKWMNKHAASRASWTTAERTSFLLRRWTEVARALLHMHEAGWVHMDVKPENVFLSKDGTTAVLGDLGGAMKAGHSFEHGKTGTVAYWPPEMLNNQLDNASHQIDLFGIGKILVLMLNVLFKKVESIPRELSTLAIMMIEHEPEKRIPLADAVDQVDQFLLSHATIRHDPTKKPPFLFGNWSIVA